MYWQYHAKTVSSATIHLLQMEVMVKCPIIRGSLRLCLKFSSWSFNVLWQIRSGMGWRCNVMFCVLLRGFDVLFFSYFMGFLYYSRFHESIMGEFQREYWKIRCYYCIPVGVILLNFKENIESTQAQ